MLIDQQAPGNSVHVALGGQVSRELAERPEWLRLCAAVRESAPHAKVLEDFSHARSALLHVGVSEDLLNGIATGLRHGSWDDAVEAFARSQGQQVNFYLGPMRAAEAGPSKTGLFLLERRPNSAETVSMLEQATERIGKAMFGAPCSFMGRHVEFYDLTAAVGPLADASASAIALFTPFYFDGWTDSARQQENRRSLLLHNVVRSRFERLTRPLVDGLHVDFRPSALCDASDEELEDAFTLWLTLHEMMHASGPMPLFAEPGHKLDLGMDYGPIEEMRVDMSAFIALGILEGELGERATLAQELIVAERLLRSIRVGNALAPEANGIGKSLDGEHGCFWGATLHAADALRVVDGEIYLAWKEAHAAIREVLTEIYSGEAAARVANDAPVLLKNKAAQIRQRLFTKKGEDYALPAALDDHYQRLHAPDRMSLTFPDC
ncbi:hypothetical protein ABZ192_11435 [Streptomyces sp. NPDC006235]|uniref:hypothetical protein n=1 Tax=Streptomyces sp. NPDC006235 TaxID=3156736 RepID=UPI0033B03A21